MYARSPYTGEMPPVTSLLGLEEAVKQKLGREVGREERGISGQGYDTGKGAWDCRAGKHGFILLAAAH